ncbi:TIGR00730 family Rossman fold protein [Patescibacteria group bacterium]|nr:TIGR00730 family Rossman fold protein [Patescibacteria group bacterium]
MNTNHRKSLKEITEDCIAKNGDNITDSRLCIIDAEFRRGFDLVKGHEKSITIFGSARLEENSRYYEPVRQLAAKIADLGYAVVTGGGHGLMGAANRGAYEAKNGVSLGINIELPMEQALNPYLNDSVDFHHFFSRKVVLAYAAEAYVCAPGGFGTLDEFFEILTLKQTKKIPDAPIVLFGSDFWKPLEEFFKEVLLRDGESTINKEDLNLYVITDDVDEIVDIIDKAPVRNDISNKHHLGHQE